MDDLETFSRVGQAVENRRPPPPMVGVSVSQIPNQNISGTKHTARLLGAVRNGSPMTGPPGCVPDSPGVFDIVALSALQHPLSSPSTFWKSCDFYIATHHCRPQMDLP